MSTRREVRDLRTADLCFIDVETTGPLFGYHEVIDIGVIRTTASLTRRTSWSTRVRPKHPERITDHARCVNGYSDDLWLVAQEATTELWEEFVQFVSGGVPVCHNPSFDRAFVTLSARDAGVTVLGLDYHWLGTESLAWPFYLDGRLSEMSLNALCDFCDVRREPNPHRAIDGANACYLVYCELLSKLGITPVKSFG